MKHFGFLCPPAFGHLNPLIILGKSLKKRGNRITFFNLIDIQKKVLNAGLEFRVVAENDYPKGTLQTLLNSKFGESSENDMLLYWNEFCLNMTQNTAEEMKDNIANADIDFLIIDQMDIIGGCIAEYLKIPFISVCNALPTNWEPSIPPAFTNLSYEDSDYSRTVNRWAFARIQKYFEPIKNCINSFREQWHLEPFESNTDTFFTSKLAQISQFPQIIDFPRQNIEQNFHYLGPFRDEESHETVDFPYHLLDGRPIIYTSLGTLVNNKKEVFRTIAEACQMFDYQLIITTVTDSLDGYTDFPGNPLVFKFVPQEEILKRASLLITHGGANTVLDALLNAVPMIVVPISLDQPAVAERIKYHKIGEVVPIKQISVEKIQEAIHKVIEYPEYKENIKTIQAHLMTIDGTKEACNIIENIAEYTLERVLCG